LKLTGGLSSLFGEVSLDLTPYANDPAAGEFLRALRDGKWRKARDAAKSLCKKDRPRYLPLLVEANVGLAREMIGKGRRKDAVPVIDYLATIAPPEIVAKLRGEVACPTASVAGRPADGGEIHWVVALGAAGGTASEHPISPEDLAAIDALVTDGFSPPEGAGEAADRLAAELATVREACAATGDGRWDEAKEALRKLPRDSVFRHWRMFLRGTRHAFGEEREMARKCFADLPPVGALARAARTLDPDLPGPGPAAPVGARVPFHLAATGQPAEWATAILDAEASEKAGKPVRAYRDLSKGMRSAFPDDRPGLACLLTESVLPFNCKMSEADYDDGFELLKVYGRGKLGDQSNALLTVVREACIAMPEDNEPGELERTWTLVLREWSRRDGADPQRDAVGWHWFGEMLAGLEETAGSSTSQENFRRAREALEKAVKADPECHEAWFSLLGVLEKSGDAKGHNQLLGEVVKRFPRNKKFLQLAGNAALDRKTYTKALKALRAALELDPLDREIRCAIAVALVRQAIDLRKKKKSATAVWEELEPLLEDRTGHAHLMLSRWIARLRRGLLETDAEAADTAMAEAEKLAPSALERLFLEEKLREAYRLPKRKTLDADWRKDVLGRPPGWEEFARIFPLADFTEAISRWSGASLGRAMERVETTVTAMIKQATDKDFAGLADFLESTASSRKGLNDDTGQLLRRSLHRIRGEVVVIMTGRTLNRIWLQLAYLLSLEASDELMRVSQNEFFEQLDQIINEAENTGETVCLAKAKALRERLKSRFGEPDPFDFEPGGSSPSLEDMLADAMKLMQDEAEEIYGASGKSAKKSAAKKRVGGDQMDFPL